MSLLGENSIKVALSKAKGVTNVTTSKRAYKNYEYQVSMTLPGDETEASRIASEITAQMQRISKDVKFEVGDVRREPMNLIVMPE